MLRYFSPIKKGKNRGDATITLILAIILISGVFLTGGILPHMEDETLNKEATSVVQGVRSEDSDGQSLIAAAGSSNDSKKTLQMKQLILATVTPTPTGTPIPTPTRTPTPTPTDSIPGDTPSAASIIFSLNECEIIKGEKSVTGTILATGITAGYLVLELEGATGVYSELGRVLFGPTSRTYNLFLTESDGVMNKKLRARLFYTVGKTGDLSGGTETAINNSDTISCE